MSLSKQPGKNLFLFSNILIVTLLLFSSAMLFSGCQGGKHPDVGHIQVELQTRRLDQDLASLDTNNIAAGLQQLKRKYPDFLDFYLDTLMGFGIHKNYNDSVLGIRLGLRPFLAHKDIRGLFDTVSSHFPDTKKLDESLKSGFRYMKYYYSSYKAPKIIYFISGLNQWSVLTVDSTILGIGLDMYLGENYPFYGAVQIPQYAVQKCKPEYVPVNAFQAIYRYHHPFVMEGRTLLDMMIQKGKEQYFLNKILPETPDTLRLGYTEAQIDWCEENEAEVYNFFITKNLLYEKLLQKTARYINDGPSAAGMPAGSPGNIGTWVGYQIVKAYVKQHPDISMDSLFALTDAQKILQESKYKPR